MREPSYLRVSFAPPVDGEAARTIAATDGVNVDLDAAGRVLGVENVAGPVGVDELAAALRAVAACGAADGAGHAYLSSACLHAVTDKRPELHGRGAAMREPTSEECTNRTRIDLDDGRIGYACWYPQMGGYVGRALAVPDPEPGGCVDVFVWHDGEFPFLGEAGGDAQPPARLHHCDGGQFVAFGEFLLSIQGTPPAGLAPGKGR